MMRGSPLTHPRISKRTAATVPALMTPNGYGMSSVANHFSHTVSICSSSTSMASAIIGMVRPQEYTRMSEFSRRAVCSGPSPNPIGA